MGYRCHQKVPKTFGAQQVPYSGVIEKMIGLFQRIQSIFPRRLSGGPYTAADASQTFPRLRTRYKNDWRIHG